MQIHVSIVEEGAEDRALGGIREDPGGERLSVVISLDAARRGAAPLDAETIVRNIVELFAAKPAAQGPQYLDRLAVKSGGRILFVRARDVDWIEADGNYVLVHVGKTTYTLRESIGNLESTWSASGSCGPRRTAITKSFWIQEPSSR
jgi:two-component system LytT family response regulator